ncbi:arsenate reductase family protein [bacterium]|nr:arsenate reductase family protein [bacterium]
MLLKIYVYKNCSTCQKALKFLNAHNIKHQVFPIRETPPSQGEIKSMLVHLKGEVKKLFNTSGQDYRTLKIANQLPSLSQADILKLLAGNGNLIKRPFVLSPKIGLVGFKEDEWKKELL